MMERQNDGRNNGRRTNSKIEEGWTFTSVYIYVSVSILAVCCGILPPRQHHIHLTPLPSSPLHLTVRSRCAEQASQARNSPLIRNIDSPPLGRMIDGFPKQDLRRLGLLALSPPLDGWGGGRLIIDNLHDSGPFWSDGIALSNPLSERGIGSG